MPLDESLFVHDSDRAAMQALRAIPGFAQFVKGYMSIWNERQFRVANMSSNLRISEKQLRKYHDMLPPICEKLGIAQPELYLELNVTPNSYTYGDTRPFIVLTSGLFETLPEALIPTVLAHECGHIACHHTMFTTMGSLILSGAASSTGLISLATTPLKMAFAYWMRCSEFSADRAAILCDGGAERMIEVCMRFAGYGKHALEPANVDAFMEQAQEYRAMVKDSKWNKTLEFLMYNQRSHPLNAVRAYECREWVRGEQFARLNAYLRGNGPSLGAARELPMPEGARGFVGRNCADVVRILRDAGFTNVATVQCAGRGALTRPGQVVRVSVDGFGGFEKGSWYAPDASILVLFQEPEPNGGGASANPNKLQMPEAARRFLDDIAKKL